MTVTLYDSTDVAAIPADAPAVAGYMDGAYANYPELVAAHPGKPVVGITVLGGFLAGTRVADVENGDLTPVTGASWARQMLMVGRRPTLYYSASLGAAVRDALVAEGINAGRDVDYWPADWTGVPHLMAGSVATQYANPDTSGGHYDLSVATEAWLAGSISPGPVPPPAPGPGPQPTPGGFMPPILKLGSLSGAVKNCQRLLNVHGAGLAVDGVYGPHTELAVRHFQTIFRLSVDGIVGPATWSALDTFG